MYQQQTAWAPWTHVPYGTGWQECGLCQNTGDLICIHKKSNKVNFQSWKQCITNNRAFPSSFCILLIALFQRPLRWGLRPRGLPSRPRTCTGMNSKMAPICKMDAVSLLVSALKPVPTGLWQLAAELSLTGQSCYRGRGLLLAFYISDDFQKARAASLLL